MQYKKIKERKKKYCLYLVLMLGQLLSEGLFLQIHTDEQEMQWLELFYQDPER